MSASALFGNRAGLGFLDGVRLGEARVALGDLAQLLVVAVQHLNFLLGEVLDVDEPVARTLQRRHDLVELELQRKRILVLRTLNQKDDQERHDRRASIDCQLPCIREAKPRAADGPHDNERHRNAESPAAPDGVSNALGHTLESALDADLDFVFHTSRSTTRLIDSTSQHIESKQMADEWIRRMSMSY